MPSDYMIQIVRRDGGIVHTMEPGQKAERDFVEGLCARVQKKGVGLGRSEKQVLLGVRSALDELLYDLKASVVP